MSAHPMKRSGSRKTKQSQRQRLSYRFVVATGIATAAIAFVLIIYFQLFKNENTNAEKPLILTQDQLPFELEVETMAEIIADTNNRDGVRFKIAKPLPVNPNAE